ncbi:Penicillin-binding protein H [Jeotgalibaca dankookensis]|uniref:Penicillin-binding protein H n=1 Tax=Jeotgalibaca dankookensis TaxID=708126 RepID=A0A1S6IN68_9LACT|nr:penicillin-binding protein 2 [Jeotgalibaca dankookensis]AQS52992.1 Penicillin-binding protein H [Jeotgalibaca dankookensis]
MNKKNHEFKKNKSHIPFRLNLLFFIVFVLFSTIIIRLGYLQIIRGEEFEAIVRRTETTLITQTVPRGLIYDRNGNVLVGNEAQHAITYTRGTNDSAASMAETALQLSDMIEIDDSGLSERDKKDFWAASNRETLLDRLTEDEKLLSGSEVYEVELAKITEQDIAFSEKQIQAAAIFKKMNGATALTNINIKNENVTEKELATVSENLAQLKGINVSKDWTRVYPNGSLLATIFGGVTSEKTGIPTNMLETYLAMGYARNDRVGDAYLEQEYETVLRGTKARIDTVTNQDGEVVTTTETYKGKPGDNLVLTVDIEFQKQIETIATNFLESRIDPWNDRVYIVAMDPNNGDIIGMTGKKINVNTGEITDSVHGVLNENFIVGSSIKGATVLAGYMSGVIDFDNNVMVDEPITFEGTERISSLFNRNGSVSLNDIGALEKSSNIYMIKIALMIGGQYNFENNTKIGIDMDDTLAQLRSYYSQFGLGVKTGIDLPSESSGILGIPDNPGLVLAQSYGQFDNYTPLQLAQYAATIANGGTRYAPRLVKEIRSSDELGGLGPIELVKEPIIMNQVNVSAEAMERVHAGFWAVTHDPGTGSYRNFANYPVGVAGKTGSGESFYQGDVDEILNSQTTNSTYVAFAPADKPEISVAVVVPYIQSDTIIPAGDLARATLDAYFGYN